MKTAPFPAIEDTAVVLEELFRHTPVGVVLSDLHGTIIDVNPALCRMIGYERSELISRSLTEFSHPDEVEDVRARTADLREGRSGEYIANRRYIARDGSIVHAKVSVSIVYTKEKEPVCGIGFIENATERVEMEAALRRSELLYRRIVEDQTDLIVRCLPDGTRTFVNEAYARYLGLKPVDLIGTSFFTALHEPEQNAIRAKYAAITPSNPVLTEQHWSIGENGEMRWHEWTDRGFFDENGTLIELQSVGRDLTEEHEAQVRLARSEERYRRLFNSLPTAVWENDWTDVVIELEERGLTTPELLLGALSSDAHLYEKLAARMRITTANPAALALGGVNSLEGFNTWLRGSLTSESAARHAPVIHEFMFGSRTWLMDEYTFRRVDGSTVDVLVRIARSPQWDQDRMTFTIAIDVSERKRIERELLHQQEVADRAEAAVMVGTWEWRAPGPLMYGSKGFWRLIDGVEGGPAERPLEAVTSRMVPEDGAKATAVWNEYQQPYPGARATLLGNDYRLIRPDGSIVSIRNQTFVTYGANGAIETALGIVRDITLAKRAEEEAARHRDELVRADKMISLGILVSGMAHEINNPNHTIALNAPLVREAWRAAATILDQCAEKEPDLRLGRLPWSEAKDDVTSMLADIEFASERIRNLVTELRSFSLDHDPGVKRDFPINEVVVSALRLLGKHISSATKRFGILLSDDNPHVHANPRRLEQIVVNLVINACQALENDQQAIHIATGASRGRAFIRVIDEGKGIAAEDMPKIRTPFFTTKRAQGGTGLGLAVSERIADEHGGELSFESAPGKGTTATLWLPVR